MNVIYEKKTNDFYASFSTGLAFGAHLHSHIELVYMLEGSAKASADLIETVISAGDVFIAFPNQIHQYQHIGHEKSIVFIFSPDICSEYKNILINKIPKHSVVKNVGASIQLHNILFNLAELKKSPSLYKNSMIKGYLLILLGLLFEKMDFESIKTTNINVVKSMLIYCMENYSKDIKLVDIADALHISQSYISHVFSQKLKTSFSNYINMLRISSACRLLVSENASITEIAYMVGFNSSRTFNRAFQSQMGMTPREYKEQENKIEEQEAICPCAVED